MNYIRNLSCRVETCWLVLIWHGLCNAMLVFVLILVFLMAYTVLFKKTNVQ